jgi:hypothetical protein
MKRTITRHLGLTLGTTIGALSLAIIPAAALVTAKSNGTTTAADQAKLQLIINRGNSEIGRRLATLQTLSSKISSATKLTANDKVTLNDEVSNEVSGLTSLKTKLDADTTVIDARTDAQSIITDYRVYALVAPKVNLVKTADDQQVAESKLSALVPKLQTRINSAQSAGKNVTALQSGLADMTKQITAAQAISAKIEASVIDLQPTDYNSNHKVLSGDRDQLKTAQTDIQAAVSDATTIVSGLKNL